MSADIVAEARELLAVCDGRPRADLEDMLAALADEVERLRAIKRAAVRCYAAAHPDSEDDYLEASAALAILLGVRSPLHEVPR